MPPRWRGVMKKLHHRDRGKFLMPWMDAAPLAGRDEEIAPSGSIS
jgi:hypothetical protein